MRAIRVAAMVVVVLAAGACTTSAPGAPYTRAEPTCPTNDKWAVGDSITSGTQGVVGWPDQHPPVPAGAYANKGIGGQIISWLAEQTDLDLDLCSAQSIAKPDRIVFQAGANDLANLRLSVAAMQSSVQALVANLNSHGVDYRLVGVLPMPSWADWANLNDLRLEFNNWLAATYPTKFVNCDPVLRSGTFLNPAYAFGDRVHLNDAGENVLAACIVAAN